MEQPRDRGWHRVQAITTQKMWPDHPEKVCAFTEQSAAKNPKTVKAVLKALPGQLSLARSSACRGRGVVSRRSADSDDRRLGATVGEILRVPFPRPGERAAVLEHAEYYVCRQRVIDFLENHARQSRVS